MTGARGARRRPAAGCCRTGVCRWRLLGCGPCRARHAVPPRAGLPSRARCVVGGGVIGCSVAYHLAEAGEDVLLLERDRLTSGTTWHAAGLMATFGSTSETSTAAAAATRATSTPRLEAETGQSTGLRQVGLVELATDADRLEEYRRIAAFNRYCGVDVHEIAPDEVAKLFPPGRRRRRARRLLRAAGRPGEPGRRDHGARQGRAAARGDAARAHAGARRPDRAGGGRAARGAGRADGARRRRGRGRRQLRRHVGPPARRGRRRGAAAAGGRALLPDRRRRGRRRPPTFPCSRTRPPTGTTGRRPAA